MTGLRTVSATRYVTPLREGGSLPALVEADDDGLYVVKFRGAGQGPLALVAEVIAGALGRALGLPVPELVLVELDPDLGRAEPDAEIQDLLLASGGLNLGMDFLPGALPYSPASSQQPSAELAAELVWFDAVTQNVDRTARNPNLLWWHEQLWAIDHGAALVAQHAGLAGAAGRAFPAISDHVLLPFAGSLVAADERLSGRVGREEVVRIVGLVPEAWFTGDGAGAYIEHLVGRLAGSRRLADEAEEARVGRAA
ncbi:MAG: HipA family kinase [Gaiellales bacterium]